MHDELQNYCTECEWTASTETHSRTELARAAIEHHIETNHEIDKQVPLAEHRALSPTSE